MNETFLTVYQTNQRAEWAFIHHGQRLALYRDSRRLRCLVSGAGGWFALRRRTASQFVRERALRLLVPFLTGTLLLGPVQIYLSWRHRSETGVFAGSLLAFTLDRLPRLSPKLFGAIGYHMWFLGFLIFSEEQFLQAIRRDWWILLAVGIAGTLTSTATAISLPSFDIEAAPHTPAEFLFWAFVVVCSWCWTAVALGAFAITISLCEGIKRVGFLCLLFGMKDKQAAGARVAAA